MDLKSFYKKIDVDTIKSRLPPLPQIKIPKIKSRKIFKSSREDISSQPQPAVVACPLTPQSLPPPSAFIDRTPTRISTVSSLMNMNELGFGGKHEHELSTYRTASNFEAEHCPDEDVEKASGSAATRFGDKCKKTYKDFSEFKIKNIFAKKTVVKKTEIEVDIYARQYERELQEEIDIDSSDGGDRDYEFEFKEARRNIDMNSFDTDSPPESDQSGVPTPLRPDMKHLQMGETPPLARRRNATVEGSTSKPRLQQSMSEDIIPEPPQVPPPIKPNRSALWGMNAEGSKEEAPFVSHRAGISKLGAFRRSRKDKGSTETTGNSDSVWSLRSIRSRFGPEDAGGERKPKKEMQAQESSEDQSESERRGAVPRKKPLPHSDSWEKSSELHASSPENRFTNIKQSIKRLKQRKVNKENSEESEQDQTDQSAMSNMSSQLRAGLKRLKMKERSISFDEDDGKPQQPTTTSRLRDWKKSLKIKRPAEAAQEDETKAPPGRSLTLRRRLNQIRVRKSDSEDGEQPTGSPKGDEQQKQKLPNLERLEQAREKAMKKVNAQIQKMRKFQGKSGDSPTESTPEKQHRRSQSPEKRPGRPKKSSPEGPEPKDKTLKPKSGTAAAWTTSKLMSESLESDLDIDDVPEVLIHQDNSDQYESTLIIMTRPAPPIPKSPIIKEITTKPLPKSDWIPNKNAISSFLETTPSPPPIKHLDVSRGHFRKRSMDSNDSDSWIPDNFRNKSCASSTSTGLNKITENSEPWTVHSVFSEEKLYKTRSIDIFSKQDDAAFEDFDDELKNVPVRRIGTTSADSIERAESTDDDDDYDNSSRITRLKRPSPQISAPAPLERQQSLESNKARRGSPAITKKGQIGNSRESLDANYEDVSTDDDDGPPSGAPSPPPSFSPPPPPLPLRRPPKHIPERNDSMVRLAKPLVKQASLRRHFSEEIEPSDLGKVNKLISRFEKTPSEEQDTPATVEDEINANLVEEKPKTAKPKEDTSKGACKKRPAPIPKLSDSTQKADELNNNNNSNNKPSDPKFKQDKLQIPGAASPETPRRQNLDNASIQSPRSEYGSPMGSMYFSESISVSSEYGSPIATTFPTKNLDQFHSRRRLSNRSSLRDDDTFYSFESDEENSFYSFGESSSTRQTIEI